MSRNLIIYYSRSGQNYVNGSICELEKGNGEYVVDIIRGLVDADIFRIEPADEYPIDYLECTEVAKQEQRQNARPKLKNYLDGLEGYDTVFLVGPCWWGDYPMPMMTQLERLDFSGKKVLPVMTHEGSGLGNTARTLKTVCRGAKIGKGLAIQGSEAPMSKKVVEKWIKKNM